MAHPGRQQLSGSVHDVAATVDALAVWRAVHAVDSVPQRDGKTTAAPRWPDDD